MRTRRRCWLAAGACCIALSLLAAGLFLASYSGGAQVKRGGQGAVLTPGRLVIIRADAGMGFTLGPPVGQFTVSGGGGPISLSDPQALYVPGATLQRITTSPSPLLGGPPLRATIVRVPLWFPLIILAAIAAVCMWRWSTLRSQGGCPGCGYDTEGITGPCPECGRAVTDLLAVRSL